MKPSAAKNTTTPNIPPPSADEALGVTDELKGIDVTPLERLLEIRKEETQLEQFRAKAEQMKDQVPDVVWRRVVADYTRRVAGLEEQATPLKAQVRTEYQKLRALLDRTKAQNDSAELEKSELEFRHAVGELSKKQLEDKLKTPTDVLERCRTDLAAIDEQKTRFLSAFASEAELEAPAPAVAPARPQPQAPPASTAAPDQPVAAAVEPKTELIEPAEDATVLAKNPLAGDDADITGDASEFVKNARKMAPPRRPAPVAEVEPDATSVVSADQVAAMSQAAKAAAMGAGESDDRTFMLPAAGLVIEGPAPMEYRLAAMNYLGRADDSHVVIARPGVSRKHALIVAGIGSFAIKDLESQNGTFVNGQRITEQPLKDGDQIVIGDTKLIFRMPWPAGGSRAKA